MKLSYILIPLSGIAFGLCHTNNRAFGQSAQDFRPSTLKKSAPSGETAPEAPATSESTAQAPSENNRFISDGSALEVGKLGAAIAPPKGWEVVRDMPGLTLFMQEPKKEGAPPDYSKPTFQRNITVAVSREARPMDEQEAKAIKAKLQTEFQKNSSLKDYQIADEHRFFNQRGTNDALVIYANYTMADIPMTQMHVVIGGEKETVLLTYTDLTSEMDNNKEAFEAAWNSMVSLSVQGLPPKRYAGAIKYGVGFAVFIAVGASAFYFRRRRATKIMEMNDSESDSDNDLEMSEVKAPTKKIKKKAKAKSDLDVISSSIQDFSSTDSAPQTVSNIWNLKTSYSKDDQQVSEPALSMGTGF